MGMSQIKIIGFDLDQTLYPKSPEIDREIQSYLYEKISEMRKVTLPEAKKLFDDLYQDGKGLSGSQTMAKLGFPQVQAGEMVQTALENADIAKFLVPDPRIINLLKNLKNKYRHIDLITGSGKGNTQKKLDKLGIPLETFSNVITADGASKSDLSAFNLWLSFHPNYKPENFLYIGDRASSDHEKPKIVGVKSILVNIRKKDPNVDCLQLQSILEIEKYLL